MLAYLMPQVTFMLQPWPACAASWCGRTEYGPDRRIIQQVMVMIYALYLPLCIIICPYAMPFPRQQLHACSIDVYFLSTLGFETKTSTSAYNVTCIGHGSVS
jgi:hypothetical protein